MKNRFAYKIFLKYFVMYLCAVLAFIILIVPIYRTIYQVTKQNIVENNMDRVFENVENLDVKLEKATTISTHIKNDSNIQKMSNMKGELAANDYLCLTRAQNLLNDLRQQYDLDLYIYIIFKNNDYFVSEFMTTPDYTSIATNFLDYEKSSLYEIREAVFQGGQKSAFCPAQQINYFNRGNINGLTYMISANSKGYGTAEYAIVFTLDLEPMLKTLKPKNRENEFLQITNNQGEILLNYQYDGETIQIAEQSIEDYALNGETYTLIHSKTEYGNLMVTKGIKASLFEEEIADVLKIIQIYIAIAIALSLLVSLWLGFKQFKGIQPILNIIKGKVRPASGKNEYQLIYSSFKNLADENKKYEEEMQAIKTSMRERLIEKAFLQGIYAEREKVEFLEYTGFQIQFFCVVSIHVLRENERVTERRSAEEKGKVNYYIRSQIDKNFDKTLSIYYGMDEIIALILLRGDESANCEKVSSVMSGIADEVIGVFGQPIEIGISNIGFGLNNVHECYQQAKRAIRQMNDQFDITVNVAAQERDELDILEDLNVEQQLYDLILVEDKAAIRELFLRLNRQIKRHSFLSEQEFMQMFFLIRIPVINARKRILKEECDIVIPNYNTTDSFLELLSALEETAMKLCEYSIQKKKSRSAALTDDILNYLNEQYVNPNLCASSVAAVFSVSEKYIFRLVKEETGFALGKYIENIRMQKARELLTDTDINAAEICTMVGFQSITTFYKSFKRVFGVAPIAYRESLRKG